MGQTVLNRGVSAALPITFSVMTGVLSTPPVQTPGELFYVPLEHALRATSTPPSGSGTILHSQQGSQQMASGLGGSQVPPQQAPQPAKLEGWWRSNIWSAGPSRPDGASVDLQIILNDLNWMRGVGAAIIVVAVAVLTWFLNDFKSNITGTVTQQTDAIRAQTEVIRQEAKNSVDALRNDMVKDRHDTQAKLDEIIRRLPAKQ